MDNINNKPEMHNQGNENVPTRNTVTVLERLRHCPDCKKKNIVSTVERLQYEEDRYWVFCTRRDGCSFLEEFRGKAVVTKEDLIMYGLPGQLIQHTDIFYEDINKIVRLCMSEYIKMKHLVNATTDHNLEAIKNTIRNLAEAHGLDGCSLQTEEATTSECQTTANKDPVNSVEPDKGYIKVEGDFVKTIDDPCSLEFLSQHSQSTKPYERDLSPDEDFLSALTGFSDKSLSSLSQTSLKHETDKYQSTADEDLVELFQSLCGEPLLPAKIEGESTLVEDQENKTLCKSEKIRPPKFHNPYDSMKKLADSLVADLPVLYQEDIKAAFSKIKGYSFPWDFVNATAPDKLPLFKILEERERQERIKADVDAQLKDFMAEIDGFNLLC